MKDEDPTFKWPKLPDKIENENAWSLEMRKVELEKYL